MINVEIHKAAIEAAIENLDLSLVMVDVIQGREDNEDRRIMERQAFDHLDKALDLMSEVLGYYENG